MGTRGKPTKLNDKVHKQIVDSIAEGNYFETAANCAGVHYDTFRRWMIKGEKAKNGKYYDFYASVKKAESEAQERMVRLWRKHMPKDWKAIATFLERRHPHDWGRREALELTGKNGGPIESKSEVQIDLSKLSDKDLDALEVILAKVRK